MRIGIDIRPLQTQESRNRGVGRYVRNQVPALLSIAQQDEIFLFYTPLLEPPALLKSAPSGPHWHAVPLDTLPGIRAEPGRPLNSDDDLEQSYALQATLSRYNLDVFHISNPFEREIAIGQDIGVCRTVATLYDLIPLAFASIYLSWASTEWRELYLHRLKLLARVDQIIAISEASKRDAVELLNLPPDRISVVSAGVDERFKPLSDRALIEAVRTRFGLPAQYIFSVLGYHYTKNIEGAIAAYSYLPASLRAKTPLVIVCQLSDPNRKALGELAKRYGVHDQVVLPGEVAHDDLVALYNGATIFFYPSRYDGFGLPVVEAMRCGTPVVTSTSSSLPEAAGKAALLGDPEDHEELAAKLELLLTDSELRQELREKGFNQAERFSWQRVAEKTLDAYRQVVGASPPSIITAQPPRLQVAYWSPLNPCKSGISDYSEQLLPHLAQYADIDIYVDAYAPTTDAITDCFEVYDYRAYPALASSRRYDVSLYQMGNSLFHEYMYEALLTNPGVVVLHDYILQNFIYHTTAGRGQRERYLDEIEYSEGSQARDDVERELAEGKIEVYNYPLNRRLVETSLGIISHSRWGQSQLAERGFRTPVAVIPLGAKVLSSNTRREALLRLSLGLKPDTLVIACFGRIVATKRIRTIVRAFNRFRIFYPRAVLFLVGKSNTDTANYLKWATAHYELGDRLRVTGYVTAEAFDNYLQISDICINLRYPSAGEISATLCQALGAGIPVMASNLPQFAEFHDGYVWKVDLGEYEEHELVAYLLELAFDRNLRCQSGRAAQDYIATHATWPMVAAQYAEFLEQIVTLSR